MARHYWMDGNRSYEQDRFYEASLNKSLWQPGDSSTEWDACWYTGMPAPEYFIDVGPTRKINHIPGNAALTVKSRLYQSLLTLRERVSLLDDNHSGLTDRLQFFPRVFSMPEDYHRFQQEALEDPGQRWILKPKNAARGKGIQLVQDPAHIPMEPSWMVQEYVENPHTMHGRKYVLRLYVAISSVVPLRVYLYRQGFAKLASAPYDEENADNPYSYLTNPDVNALNLEAEVPVEFVDLDRYRTWLREQGQDDAALFAQIEDLVALTCVSALEDMRERSRVIGADTRGCYELLGIDCLVDSDLKPWILECNLSPSLDVCAGPESGGNIEKGIKGTLVKDLISLVGLNNEPVKEAGSPERQVVAETEHELARAGNFKRLLPSEKPADYLPFYALPRLEDWVVAQSLSRATLSQPVLRRRYAEDMISEDRVYVYDTRLGRLNALNESGSLIWLMATDGHEPDDIATALAQASAGGTGNKVDSWTIRRDVWNSLADWANHRLLVQKAPTGARRPDEVLNPAGTSHQDTTMAFSFALECGAFNGEFFTDSLAVISRIRSLLLPMEAKSLEASSSRLEVVRDMPGYTLIMDGRVIQSRLGLSRVAPSVMACLTLNAAEEGDIIVDAGLVTHPSDLGTAILVTNINPELGDLPALRMADRLETSFGRAGRISGEPGAPLYGLSLPAQVPYEEQGATIKAKGQHHLQDDRKVWLQPASLGLIRQGYQVNTVIIPTSDALGEENGMRPVSVSEALCHLISGCSRSDGQPLDTAGFTRLANWLESAERYLVDINNLDAALEVLAKKFAAKTDELPAKRLKAGLGMKFRSC